MIEVLTLLFVAAARFMAGFSVARRHYRDPDPEQYVPKESYDMAIEHWKDAMLRGGG